MWNMRWKICIAYACMFNEVQHGRTDEVIYQHPSSNVKYSVGTYEGNST